MSVKQIRPNPDLAEKVNKLNFCLTLLIQQLENVEEIDKGILELVKKIIAS